MEWFSDPPGISVGNFSFDTETEVNRFAFCISLQCGITLQISESNHVMIFSGVCLLL